MPKQYNADDLVDWIMTCHTIQCTRCNMSLDNMMSDEYGAAEGFFKDGWRSTGANVYCPSCAAIKLKSKTS